MEISGRVVVISRTIRFPAEVYREIERQAKRNRRSFNAQVIVDLEAYHGISNEPEPETDDKLEESE